MVGTERQDGRSEFNGDGNKVELQSGLEIWVPCPIFPGQYFVSSLGQVRHKSGRIKKAVLRRDGYYQVKLSEKYDYKMVLLHRLIAMCFLENPDGLSEVNHINGKRRDFRLDNLEWVSRSQNMKHKYRIGLTNNRGEKNPRAKLTPDQVICIRAFAPTKENIEKICAQFPVGRSAVEGIIRGRRWKHLL